MAGRAGWSVALAPVTRWVAVHGLASGWPAPTEPLDEGTWSAVRAECYAHGLAGLLVAVVADDALPATAAQRAEAAEIEVELTRTRMQAERNVLEVAAWFAEADLEVRLLKGLALATLDYPDAQWRPTGDVDLLVHGYDLERAVRLLTDRGGEQLEPDPVPGYGTVVGKGAPVRMPSPPTEVDLHRLLVWGPLGVRLRPDELWRTARPVPLGGRELLTLGVEETLLHAACHLLIGGTPRALSLRDVAQLMSRPGLDGDRAIALAERWGIAAVLATAVTMAATELRLDDGGPLLEWARRRPIGRRDALWLRVHPPDGALIGLEALATYLELRTPAERRMLRTATLRPVPGTWPGPRQRVGSAVRRLTHRA